MPSRSSKQRRLSHDHGLLAEKIAAWYLRCKGYRIIAERYRNHYGEIDLLATRGRLLAVVEVKARQSLEHCSYSVPPHKQQKIMRALQGLMAENSKIAALAAPNRRDIRFDVVWITHGWRPHHIHDAWRP